MDRVELRDRLQLVEPALSSRDLIPVFSCFLFDGERAVACNDVVAIAAKCPFPLVGGVLGRPLLDWLSASRAKKIEVLEEAVEEGKPKEVVFKGGHSKLKLGVTPKDDFLFKLPKKKGDSLPGDPKLVEAINRAAVCMGKDPAQPWSLGVAMRLGKDGVTLWTCDNFTASKAHVSMKVPKELSSREFTLSPKFVELFVAIGKKSSLVGLDFGDGWVEAWFKGEVRLWGKTLPASSIQRFEDVFSAISKQKKFKTIPIPKGFANSLSRTLVVLQAAADKHAEIRFVEGKIKLSATSPIGEVKDSIPIPSGHPEVSERVLPDMVLRCIEEAEGFALLKDSCFLLEGKAFQYAVSIVRAESE